MKNFHLSEADLAQMRHFYEYELLAAEQKVAHIRSILKKFEKLGLDEQPKQRKARTPKAVAVAPEKKKRGRKAKAVKAVKVTKAVKAEVKELAAGKKKIKAKKRGRPRLAKKPVVKQVKERNSKWGTFILSTLKEKNSPMTMNELINTAISKYSIPAPKQKNLKQSIQSSAFRLRTVNKKIDSFAIRGMRHKFVVLKEWFSSNGKLQKEYKEKAIKGN